MLLTKMEQNFISDICQYIGANVLFDSWSQEISQVVQTVKYIVIDRDVKAVISVLVNLPKNYLDCCTIN